MNNQEISLLPEFREFILREFENTVQYALIEDLAIFAFGSMEVAIKDFKKKCDFHGYQNS